MCNVPELVADTNIEIGYCRNRVAAAVAVATCCCVVFLRSFAAALVRIVGRDQRHAFERVVVVAVVADNEGNLDMGRVRTGIGLNYP